MWPACQPSILQENILQIAVLVLSLVAIPLLADGRSFYRYEDPDGTVHFSDVRADDRFERVEATPQGLVVTPDLVARPPIYSAYDPLIIRTATAHRLRPGLVKAVIAAESNFDPGAVSKKGAQGLMQLMPQTARALGVRNAFHPEQNVWGGSEYLRRMLDRYGDVQRALAAYNAGPKAVDRYRGIPPYPETRAYVMRVLNYYRRYDEDFRP